ncbi:nickel ABC transporter permease [Sulfuriflexus sp.]|uniref:nickel ABC transporter permease n=1 Tax=Sulfuriflexus sp. TaxID=2015443 RepID=UPI0028CE3984|nr:nickel ABC transporter permease [Sulfuriflexus sp.]MDT8403709.1 ABC transporter permease [Sulfuriflexus sp.]
MARIILNRLLGTLFVLFGVSLLVFLLIHLVPGDPVEVILGEQAQAADRESLRLALGLDKPMAVQWWEYMRGLLHADLGHSLYMHRPVSELLIERLPASAELALLSLLIAVMLALPLGLIAATQRGSGWDWLSSGFSLLGIAIPNFVFGPLLILLFSIWLGWLPVSGREQGLSIVLPALTLGTAMAAILSRMLRSSLLEVLGEDFVRSARARGLHPLRVLFRHALNNAMLPLITLLGLQLGGLLAGAVITETVFDWPGIGRLTIEAIQRRDYPLLQGCVLFISLVYVLINLLTDMTYRFIDPRIRVST